MSRKIKFRAWDKSRGRFFTCRNWVEFGVNKYGVLSAKNIERGGGYVKLPIQQFTGLHDKNGKEIYEGDVLYSELYNKEYIVGFCNGCFSLKYNNGKENGKVFYLFNHMQGAKKRSIEVIGNIHENPELLNEL
jgi:uncharacterized phage protein (TIGR01671 family)